MQKAERWKDKDVLEELYWDEGMGTEEIGEELGCSHMTVYNWMKKLDVPIRSCYDREYGELYDEELLKQWYVEDGLRTGKIADRIGCSTTSVRRRLKAYGVELEISKEFSELEDEEWVREQYVDEVKSMPEIANELGCVPETVARAIKEHGIKTRTSADYTSKRAASYCVSGGYPQLTSGGPGGPYSIRVHRLLAIAEYGVEAVKGNHVHHKNGVKWDNRPDNIEIMSPEDHKSHHMKEMHEQGVFEQD